eukprot:6810405-Pyramimonas_sp.AAC.1
MQGKVISDGVVRAALFFCKTACVTSSPTISVLWSSHPLIRCLICAVLSGIAQRSQQPSCRTWVSNPT